MSDDAYLVRATTADDGQIWDTLRVYQNGDTLLDGRLYFIENFAQLNNLYTDDGTFHIVMGAVQGVLNASTSELIDNFPILYWNSRDRQLVEITSDAADSPSDTSTVTGLTALRPGNGLGNAYPQLSEGPNGDLVAIWQQWEDDGS
ncbi:MAG: hypothetical protein GWN61_18685, partial [candidate division Zixibacteria bacterium]|nr:hypothetical protein [candidate division KSB1 bacterium]NIR66289.1 hypothetical protein [candidate division Zixibacteria bacterium]NIS47878.1 hypothetical protein [candidate division Zixibacteria bacterium]NIT73543.1 hypothetical protein [candidate division KSB1 bacterium]NIU15996.1 hypothetical protein [candidate division Zixibacteria bacterium]